MKLSIKFKPVSMEHYNYVHVLTLGSLYTLLICVITVKWYIYYFRLQGFQEFGGSLMSCKVKDAIGSLTP